MDAPAPSPRRPLFVPLAWVAALAIVGLSAFLVWTEWHTRHRLAEGSVLNTARVLAHQVEASFDQADALLRSIGERYAAATAGPAPLDAGFGAQVRRELPYYPLVARIGLIDAGGRLVFNSLLAAGDTPSLDASDRDYFRRARDGDTGLLFSGPLKARLTGEWVLTLARRLPDRDGRFSGVAYAVLPVRTIGRTFAGLDLGSGGVINLRTREFAQVVRHPPLAGANREIGNRNVSRTIRNLVSAQPGRRDHVYRTTAPIDGVERVYAYQAFGHSPFWMTVGRASGDFAGAWWRTAVPLSSLSVGMAALLVWGAYRLDRQNRILEYHRQHLEHLVAARTADLRAANQELDAFAFAVTHDLRAPLRAMSGFAQAVQEDYGTRLDPKGRQFLDQIVAASRRMGGLIDGILALSRTTRGGLQRQEVDLSALAETVLADLRRAEPDRRVASEVQPGLAAVGDRAMLEAVMQNLVGNAWKYTAGAPEARIRVTGEPCGDGVRIAVADNGAGFDMEHAARLFQPFQRLHRQDEFPGLGIGLATAQRIIRRHGGEIAAAARPGAGATFTFTLPGTAPELRAGAAEPA